MEGLIPYVLHALKKTRPQHKFRTSSNNSNRSYHLLGGNDSLEGSSHRRTRSEFPAPMTADLFENRSENIHQFGYSRSYKEEGGAASAAKASLGGGGSKNGFYPYHAAGRK